MNSQELFFKRPETLQATLPPEYQGRSRDDVRLMVTSAQSNVHATFRDLPRFLRPGDLLVVNRSKVIPASLPAQGRIGPFLLNLSTHYGQGLWLAEPRWSVQQPGPLPFQAGEGIVAAGLPIRFVGPHPGLPRLWFVQFDGDWERAIEQHGQPIRYGYVEKAYPLRDYQTIFASQPGSAEMPSAARPFTQRVLDDLHAHAIEIADVVLHTGVSSHEVETDEVEDVTLYAEPFWVPAATAGAVNRAREESRRVIAVGTTVVRALESAWYEGEVRPVQGFTHLYVHPQRGVHTVDGILTGLHDSMASHLAMLYAISSPDRVRAAYTEAVREGYLWHEFGDSHLLVD